MLHCAVEGEAAAPPATPGEGQCWLVAAAPTGDWAGAAGKLAGFIGGGWIFFEPRDGMSVLNRTTGQVHRSNASWMASGRPAAPSGGTTIDTQARSAISAILDALAGAGILPAA